VPTRGIAVQIVDRRRVVTSKRMINIANGVKVLARTLKSMRNFGVGYPVTVSTLIQDGTITPLFSLHTSAHLDTSNLFAEVAASRVAR
jgi:hypothetical protein